MTTLYKIDGEYVSLTEANRMGYTTSPSNPVSYKSADPQTWGQTEGNGLMQGDLSNPISGSYFVEGELGWVNIENLSLVLKLYPSTAEDVVMHNTNTGNDSAGVKIESNGDYYYLISGDLSHGWIVESDLDEFDWEEKGAATLPTVSDEGDFARYNWLETASSTVESIPANGYSSNLRYGSTTPSYDSTKSYGVIKWQQTAGATAGRVEFIIDHVGGKLQAKNITNGTLSFYQARVAVCSSNAAEIVTVYDSNDNAYNAFKYDLDGVDYYYVLDEIQTDWTSDLSSIGYHLPIPSDTATGTINNLALPTAHKEWYTDVTFESLRYYVKGTLSNTGSVQGTWLGIVGTWYYGVITWTDESVGDLTEKIAVSNFTQSAITPQSVFRIIFICDGSIKGYHPSDTSESNYNFVSAYTYNNGVHSITFHSTDPWTSGTYLGRIQFRYLDGTTTFKNLSAFDLIGVENGVLSILTTTDRFDMYNTWAGNLTIKAYYAEPTTVTTYNNPVTNSVYAKWRGNATSDPNYSSYFRDVNGVSVGSYYGKGTYMNKFYLNIPNNKYVSDAITGVTADGIYFERASSSSNITDSTKGILILNKDIYGWYIILSFYSSDISDGNYALDGSITLGTLGPALPTVSSFYEPMRDSSGQQISIVSNQSIALYGINTSSSYPYNTSVTYAAIKYASGNGGWSKVSGIFEIANVSNLIGITNVSSSTQSFYSVMISVCSSSNATVEMVLDADNNRYNAFKYTSNGTDYYYVLDGVQAGWTDDLSSIGYHLRPEIVFGLKWRNGAWSSENFDYNPPDDNYWYMGIVDPTSVSAVGLGSFATDSSPYGYVSSTNAFKFEVIKVYAEIGTNPISGYDVSTFTFTQRGSVMTINNLVKNATSLKSYLCRVTPPEPLVVLLCVRWDSNRWIAPDFVANDWFYTGIRNNDDKAIIHAFGLSTTTAAPNAGTVGNIVYNSGYDYEILEIYSDIGQTVSSYTNLSNLSMGLTSYGGSVNLLTIQNVTAINSGLIMSYKLRITKKQS